VWRPSFVKMKVFADRNRNPVRLPELPITVGGWQPFAHVGRLARICAGEPSAAIAPWCRVGDINNDGNVDIVVLNVGEPPSLLAEPHCERESPCAIQVSRNEEQ